MFTDRGSELPADSTRGEPGSEAIHFVKNPQQLSTPIPTLAAIVAAEKLANGAADLLRLFKREPEPGLIQSARTRLKLALDQLEERPTSTAEHCRYPGERSNCAFPACECGLKDGWQL